MVNKLHIKHKNAVFNGEASKWQAKEYMHDYREVMKWDARFYGLPLLMLGRKTRGFSHGM